MRATVCAFTTLLLLSAGTAHGYSIQRFALSSGGDAMTSPGYRANQTIALTASGPSVSPSYQILAGFWIGAPLATGIAGFPPAAEQVEFQLHEGSPNPFNPQVTLQFDLPAAAPARLDVFDANGRLVRTLVNGEQAAGRHEAQWDGRDVSGVRVASGLYMARLLAGGQSATRKLIMVK